MGDTTAATTAAGRAALGQAMTTRAKPPSPATGSVAVDARQHRRIPSRRGELHPGACHRRRRHLLRLHATAGRRGRTCARVSIRRRLLELAVFRRLPRDPICDRRRCDRRPVDRDCLGFRRLDRSGRRDSLRVLAASERARLAGCAGGQSSDRPRVAALLLRDLPAEPQTRIRCAPRDDPCFAPAARERQPSRHLPRRSDRHCRRTPDHGQVCQHHSACRRPVCVSAEPRAGTGLIRGRPHRGPPSDDHPPGATRPWRAATAAQCSSVRADASRCHANTRSGDCRIDASRNHAKARGRSSRSASHCAGRCRQPQLLPARSPRASEDVVHPQTPGSSSGPRHGLSASSAISCSCAGLRERRDFLVGLGLSCLALLLVHMIWGGFWEGGYSFSQRILTALLLFSSSASPSSFVVEQKLHLVSYQQ